MAIEVDFYEVALDYNDWTDRWYIDAVECNGCGSLVAKYSTQSHENFHRKLDETYDRTNLDAGSPPSSS